MTVTGTVTREVSKRMTSPSTVSPLGLIFDSVIPPLSSVLAGSGFVGFGSAVFRPHWGSRMDGKRQTLKNTKSGSLVLFIKIPGLEVCCVSGEWTIVLDRCPAGLKGCYLATKRHKRLKRALHKKSL